MTKLPEFILAEAIAFSGNNKSGRKFFTWEWPLLYSCPHVRSGVVFKKIAPGPHHIPLLSY